MALSSSHLDSSSHSARDASPGPVRLAHGGCLGGTGRMSESGELSLPPASPPQWSAPPLHVTIARPGCEQSCVRQARFSTGERLGQGYEYLPSSRSPSQVSCSLQQSGLPLTACPSAGPANTGCFQTRVCRLDGEMVSRCHWHLSSEKGGVGSSQSGCRLQDLSPWPRGCRAF